MVHLSFRAIVALIALVASLDAAAQVDVLPYKKEESANLKRQRERMAKWLAESKWRPITDKRVIHAFATVPRHMYVLKKDVDLAYKQKWLRLGWGQTITDPSMVAHMTNLLEVKEGDKVLEIGTGSGYQASILAELTSKVFSIEIVGPLARRTHKLLKFLGYDKKVTYTVGDGYFGWKDHAPFDKIIVTCAADHIPVPLLQQLKTGGTMVIPIGTPFRRGKLILVKKDANGKISQKVVGSASFVPLTRKVR
ncbi:MAG: protein-L-isoaspartate(D-aspartate) O-methyltransferase [Myxococcales bacterium]|nr:protein-L-isoaspartate(D-aspartate) O-methyltransferase [Myxococcales bacterium]